MAGTPLPTLAKTAWAALAWNVGVIVWGAFVRASKSGAGCGEHWPLCKGHILPDLASATTRVELVHRVTSFLAMVLVYVVYIGARRAYTKGNYVRRMAGIAALVISLEALLGAGLVLLAYVDRDQSVGRAVWMALHLINTFVLLATITLTAWYASGNPEMRLRGQGAIGKVLTIALLLTMTIATAGSQAALADTLFPAHSLVHGLTQDLDGGSHFLLQFRLIHAILAMTFSIYLFLAITIASALRPTRAVKVTASMVGSCIVIQLALGFTNVALLAPVWMQLVHLFNADLVWISLVLLCAACLPKALPTAATAPIGDGEVAATAT
ncbi:MAG: COX15/CtaA family protein [Sandaracinaceae bacterium]|nr:COX15/CtaA family protein [Sandaracinaceae bacterium]